MTRQTLNDWPRLARDWTREEPDTGCMVWLRYKNPKGYGMVRIDRQWVATHRVAFRYYHGPIPSDSHILHDCDNPSCVNPLHLRSGTNSENIADKVSKGRQGKKLKPGDADKIRALVESGMPQREAGAMFGIHQASVSKIMAGRRWVKIQTAGV